MIELHRILTEARDLVAKGHTKLAAARTAEGVPCSALSDTAAAYCVMGALAAAGAGDEIEAAQRALLRTGGWTGYPLASWNDVPERTQADVVALFDKTLFEIGAITEMEYVLRQAKTLLLPGFTQKFNARVSATNEPVSVAVPSADVFCTWGSVCRVFRSTPADSDEAWLVLRAISSLCDLPVPVWNDDPSRTHEEVLAFLDRCIAAAHADKYWGLE